MVTDQQVRLMMKLSKTEKTLSLAAAKAGMDEKTARKYHRLRRLPSEVQVEHAWRTRDDPFAEVWDEVCSKLENNPGLQAKTLFEDLQRRYPGRFADGQLRTLQRRVKVWRALEGPGKEVFFPQKHFPGVLCQSDFTHMDSLGVTIARQPFDHLIYHFVLTYSNWETGSICFSESFESLAEGLQGALWELGGTPVFHQTDRMSAAVSNLPTVVAKRQAGLSEKKEFTKRYEALLHHYGMDGRKIQPGKANEDGDIEQRHHRFKVAVDQALMLRGSRDFVSREAYETFLRQLFNQLNASRRGQLNEEMGRLRPLPQRRLDASKKLRVKVGPNSTIPVQGNVYSVHSRLIGEHVAVRLFAEHLEVWYAQKKVETMPRMRGKGRHHINYRHIIDWLVHKPGAFEQYRYHNDLFPSSRFRIAYDVLKQQTPSRASKEYLQILQLAARETEAGVDDALRVLLDQEQPIDAKVIEVMVLSRQEIPPVTDVTIDTVDLSTYDQLLSSKLLSNGLLSGEPLSCQEVGV